MELTKAREYAQVIRVEADSIMTPHEDEVIVTLDDRITELEAQRDVPFRELLDWLMCSDPWPGGDENIIKNWINDLAIAKGYKDWIGAYHKEQ